ncbi:MAG: tetratricopeptide repeat protein [Bdellovibrionales bacterium]|jgi:tetratricopeptide (TPR) repeat protein|nr:tetratricopeptide repeat protein [Bdellovibrionales bacterium]MBT3525499.1 tetratricopeptide repeat protein [Bdellovibrionales bacterium]MBT7670412.1 tetratricopeptide repeat protein [Bdellovibrionales bacterium]MBT7766750.1 tetratricopeptide repeat protein [Bdellovibrionales bacterium]
MKKRNKLHIKFSLTFFLFFFLITSSCDFSSQLHNTILDAQQLVSTQSYPEAVLLYEKILDSNPSVDIKLKISYQLGELYSTYMGNYRQAIIHFSNVKKFSKDPLWSIRAEEKIGEICFVYLKDYSCATLSYKKLSNITPRLKMVDFYLYRLGLSYVKNSEILLAQRILNRISRDAGHEYNLEAQYELGLLEFHQKRWKSAIIHWRKYLSRETKRESVVRVKFMIANAYEMLEELKKAYDIYYSILGEFSNPKVIKNRLNSIYARKVARKR